jgi:hypothetical protein
MRKQHGVCSLASVLIPASRNQHEVCCAAGVFISATRWSWVAFISSSTR